ncbi:MAG TPA: lysophospholipid acyltransferase family protein [Anaerolineaceae bacterium]|nr:lysophospholipid acyltransferase family protein [Anaerolineaceae bacterium]
MNETDVNEYETLVRELSASLMNEVVGAVGLPKNDMTRSLMWRIVGKPALRLARIGVTFERLIAEKGLPVACAWSLTHFCNPAQVTVQEEIPREGPLLLAANHPGAYDVLVYTAMLKRKDVCWIATEIPFLRLLPNASSHIFYVDRTDMASRSSALRQIARHLKSGGAMVYFASGHRDPDPAVFPGAEKGMDEWLKVYDLLYRYVPDLKVQPVLASGIVSEHWARHRITRLRRRQLDRHRLAEFGQVISQLLNPGRLMITPAVSVGRVVSLSDLVPEKTGADITAGVISLGKTLLHAHAEQYGCAYL